jgi:hypothetical protein
MDFDPALSNEWFLKVVIYAHIWMLVFYMWENLVCVRLFLWWNARK